MNVVLVYNPRAGSAFNLSQLRKIFNDNAIHIDAAIPVKVGYETQVKRHVVASKVIAVVGGDGTISAIAHMVQGTQAILAPLPGGTLNHFTKDLGISQDIQEAIAALATRRVKHVDVAQINGRTFVNNSSLGLYPSSLQVRRHFEDYLGKWPAMVIGGIRAWLHYQPYHISVDNRDIIAPMVFVGNNDYHLDDLQKFGRSRLDKGLLSVYAIHATSRMELLKVLLRSAMGNARTSPDAIIIKAERLVITSHKPKLKISRDGELNYCLSPLTYEILPRALKVIGSS